MIPNKVVCSPSTENFSKQIFAVSTKDSDGSQLKSNSRTSNKLLTTVGSNALALVRLDQVDAAEKGEVVFRLANDDKGLTKDCTVTHRWPEWWPRPQEQ